jgi:hypothetical protein
MSCSVSAFTFMAVPVGVGEGKAVGVDELVGACVLVGVPAGPADGAGVAVFVKGLTLVGVGAGRSVGVAPTAIAATASVAAGTFAIWGASAGPIRAQPDNSTAANRIAATSVGGLAPVASALSGIITLT